MSEPFLGQIMAVGFNFAREGGRFATAKFFQFLATQALFALLGTTYGGDGRTTFALPDLRGRSIRHAGSGPGLPPLSQGQRGGNVDTVLIANNLPAHSHTITNDLAVGVSTQTSNADDPDGGVLGAGPEIFVSAAADTQMGADSIQGTITAANTGNSTPFSNLPPYLGIYYCIALQGIFPSRSFQSNPISKF